MEKTSFGPETVRYFPTTADGNLQNKKRRKQVLDAEQWKPARYEVEYYQHESDLQYNWENCKKYPDHLKFIPVSRFKFEHLPEGHRDNLLWDFIQSVIFLTVRLTIKYTSKWRSDTDGSAFLDVLDMRLDLRGTKYNRVGTGMVSNVYREFTEKDGQSCPCAECQKSPDKAKRQWSEFGVDTASHVVYDNEECRKTRCDVWFDNDGDKDKCPKLEGVKVVDSNIEKDMCKMKCITHDENVYNKMAEMVRQYDDLRGKLCDRYRNSSASKDMRELPVFCISHPHGMCKHVTVGVVSGEDWDYPFRWNYTTETCPGSSGAPVFTLREWEWPMWPGHVVGRQSTHSGCERKGENHCGHVGWW